MIISTKILVKISPPNITHYRNNGFSDIKVNDLIEVDVSFLPKNSNIKIEVECSVCNKRKACIYTAYNRYIDRSPDGKYRCNKCNNSLRKRTLKERYGSENYTNVDKYKSTMNDRYGGHCNKLDIFKEKIRKTCKERYGVYYPMQSEIIKDKYVRSIIYKYNVDYPFSSDLIREKSKKTMLVRHGGEYSMQVESIKEKILKTSKRSKIEKIIKNNDNITSIDYENNLYKCFCNICESEYDITPHIFIMRSRYNTTLCTKCNSLDKHQSGREIQLLQFIKSIYDNEVIESYRDGLEIDIYLPDLKLGFEFNGLYWHCEKWKDKNYHLEKNNYFKSKGINILHIWEDDWVYRSAIVKSIILNKLGKSNRVFARKCKIVEIADNKIVRDFLMENHIQGFVGSKVKLGLYHNSELVCLMTFGNLRKNLGQKSKDGHFELLRFCNKLNYTVVGGASKLLNHFIKNYKPVEIISYSDNSRSDGDLYEKIGFEMSHLTSPNYYWLIDNNRVNRFEYRKDKLVKDGYDINKTELEIMSERGYYRIFDCGSSKYVKKLCD